MSEKVTIGDQTLFVRKCTANEWFDAVELEKVRDQDYALIAICVVDDKGKPVYAAEDVGELDVIDYARLYNKVITVNRPEKPEKK